MFNNQSAESKFNCTVFLDGTTGIKGSAEYAVFVESQARVDVIGVGGSNVLEVEARIRNTSTWTSVKTIAAASTSTVDISTYDFIRFNVTTADGSGSANASGFITNLSSGGGGGGGGDASAANQVIGNASLAAINTKTPALVSGRQPVDGSGVTQPISAASLPLPSGASTEATLSSLNSKVTTVNTGAVVVSSSVLPSGAATESTLLSIDSSLPSSIGAKTIAGSTSVNIASDQVVPVSASSLPLPVGAATEATLSAALAKLPSSITSLPDRNTSAQPVTVKGQNIFRTTFSSVIANNVDSAFWTLLQTGSGQTINQAAGNLVLTSGTTTNAETIIRSNQTFKGNAELKWSTILSQRIVNQNFYIELVDLIGDSLAYTINSATSVTVTIPSNPFTSINVGHSLNMQQIAGTAGTIPGRYAIASVSGNDVTFTVAGFPASGTGTMSLVGWNYVRATYTGATATNVVIETQRRGYNTNASFNATINTTASPGHIGVVAIEDGQIALLDQLQAAAASLLLGKRAEIVQSLPEENTAMYLQIHLLNGSTAPASTTTWTIGMASVATRVAQNVAINSVSSMSQNTPVAMTVVSGTLPTVTTVTTVTGVTTVSAVTAANLNFPQTIADVASAALTTTTTTAAFTPTFGISYQINIPVTAVTGTTPTLDVSIEESDDGGTNWYKVYDFPRITATGIYRSPHIPLFGNRVRYVQTVTGTTPSFTRAVNRLQSSYPALPVRQLIDRTISLTTLNSVTPTILARDCGNSTQLVINVGAITTTAPAIQLEGSDDFGLTWYAIGSPLTAVASSTVQVTVNSINAAALRARVSTAGVGVTAGYLMIKAHD